MSEEVVEAGFARIEAALPSLGDGPQYETSELLVFQRSERVHQTADLSCLEPKLSPAPHSLEVDHHPSRRR
jgi:hypothetical protein